MFPAEKQQAAQKRAKRAAQKKQNKTRPETLLYANWMLLATSWLKVDPQLSQTYRQRWQIEIFFKTAKTGLNFHKPRRCSDRYAANLIMIWMAIVLSICSLYKIARSAFSAFPSFFFSFDFLLALFP